MTKYGRLGDYTSEKPDEKKPLYWHDFLVLIIVTALLVALFFHIVLPKYRSKRRDEISFELQELLSQSPNVEIDEVIQEDQLVGRWVDPEANKIAGEGYDFFEEDHSEMTFKKGEKFFLQPIANLIIDAIDLNMIILNNASLVELRYGAGQWAGSDKLFDPQGKSVILGHHMLEYGHNFNQLEELKPGDPVKVLGNQKEYTYSVEKSTVIAPHEFINIIESFDVKEGDKYMILVTCTPYPDFQNRLLVYTKLVDTKDLKPNQ